jgi:type I restriction enzyme S subunit
MSNSWPTVVLGNICVSANTGLDAIKRAPIVEKHTGIKCLRIQDISQSKPISKWGNTEVTDINFEKFRLRTGEIIMARTCSTGLNLIVKEDLPAVFNNGLVRIRADKKSVTPEFLYYLFMSKEFIGHIDGISGGTSVQLNMQIGDLLSYTFPLPPLSEQQAIAEVLSSLDDKIALLHRNNKTLEEMAETLFRQWFVEGAKEDWEEYPLDNLAEYLNGLALQKFPAVKGQPTIPAIKIREMNQGLTDSTDRVSPDIPEKYLVYNGDILFSWSGSLDVIIWSEGTGALNQHLFKVIPKILPKWLVYFATRLFLPDFRDIANDKATTMGHIQRHHLSDAKIKLPDFSCIPQYDKIIDPIFSKLLQNKEQINKLKSLRDSLLPKLMTGQVRVNI